MARTPRLLATAVVAVSLTSLTPLAPLAPLAPLTALAPPAVAKPSGTTVAVAVAAARRPGSAGDHTWLFDRKITWPSCGTITYEVNPSKAPRGWKRLVKRAVQKVHQASRLRFTYLGRTKVKPVFAEANPAGTDIVIAFLDPGQTDMLGGPTVAGQGSAATDGTRLFDGKVVLSGKVFHRLAPGFGAGPRYGIQGTQGQVVMHELGHVVGLGHARHRTQVMFPAATRKPAAWGAGDWAGLRALGKGGCDQPPPATPVRVRSLS